MDQLPRLGKRELICLLLFTCDYVVSVWRGFLFLCVLRKGYVIFLWHSLSLPYNYFVPYYTKTIMLKSQCNKDHESHFYWSTIFQSCRSGDRFLGITSTFGEKICLAQVYNMASRMRIVCSPTSKPTRG